MKRIRVLLVVAVLLFLSGCDTTGDTPVVDDSDKFVEPGDNTNNDNTGDLTNDLEAPIVNIVNERITFYNYRFDVEVIDVDSLYTFKDIKLYKGEELIETKEYEHFQFNNLVYNTDYKYEIHYTYDLNDGNGVVEATKVVEFKTYWPSDPMPSIFVTTAHRNGFNFELTTDFEVDMIEIISVTAVKGGMNSKTVEGDGVYAHMSDLQFDTTYVFEIEIAYRFPGQENITTLSYTTLEHTTEQAGPVEVHSIDSTSTTVTFGIDRYDNNEGTILEISIRLYDTDIALQTLTDHSVLEFTGLDPNTKYEIYIHYENDNASVGEVAESEGHYTVTTKE